MDKLGEQIKEIEKQFAGTLNIPLLAQKFNEKTDTVKAMVDAYVMVRFDGEKRRLEWRKKQPN